MNLEIAGKTALVTGGSQGIGKAVCQLLAREGVRVVVSARNEETIQKAVEAIRLAGGEAFGIEADVTRPESISELFERSHDLAGDPDILIVNAGGPQRGTPTQLDEEAWLSALDLTLMSAVRLARAALPAMQAKGWGRIVNITSISVKQPILNLTLSNTYRAAVTGFAKSLALELAPQGITVNNVGPGYTDTERLNELFQNEEAKQALMSSIPAQRFATPEEVAALVVFLASEQAAYITGQTVTVDGGAYKGLF